MAENKVGYSRAGDTFHYRWAARRALKLIYPNNDLSLLVVEGSKEDIKAGEYVIDISEYYGDQDAPTKIIYYQLKHTTVQGDKPFILSDLKDTFVGFGEKFTEWNKKNEIVSKGIQFSIVTNRPFEASVKQNLAEIRAGNCTDKKFVNTLSRYTKLKSADLSLFCSILKIEDAELGYNLQKQELRIEIARLVAGTVENAQLSSLTTLISEKVLPDSDGTVYKENVLQSFGFQSENELYPAKPIWEPSGPIVEREIYKDLPRKILASSNPVIVHAPGGVGKSVFTRFLINNIGEGSEVIAYDCFGAGSYRNRSKSRHRHRDALVEIANELAAKGLCDPLLVQNGTQEAEIIRSFIRRIDSAVKALRAAYKDGILLLLVDAADNAEMAAKEMNDICFAAELLREKLPEGCKLVYLCRPERIDLLKPESYIVKIPLSPFSLDETLTNLKFYFPDTTVAEAEEFHRLTSANPRVQANALAAASSDVATLLANLGPSVITVEAQIQQQLEQALNRLKDNLPSEYHQHLNNICVGLASLSPNIPIDILAKVAEVNISAVKSFVTDIGRSLWLYDDSVQFRDEPSETWFRQYFVAGKDDFKKFVRTLEPLADHSSYAAEVLPQLYLQAEQYDELIALALSDNYLPAESPIDQRNIRIYRLQFALKAALKINNLKDACKLALRAGEETAGNERQASLLRHNVYLLVRLQSKEKIQQMAMRRELSGFWEGSENIYSASLLSRIKEFQGEARSFLRSAENWLDIYFKTPKNPDAHEEDLKSIDILELADAHLNLNGVKACMAFLLRLKPKPIVSKIFGSLISRLIDGGNFDAIDLLLKECKKEPLFILAANNTLAEVGRFCGKKDVTTLLKNFTKKPIDPGTFVDEFSDSPDMSIIALAEAAISHGISNSQIVQLVDKHLPAFAGYTITQSYHRNQTVYQLRSLSLRQFLSGKVQIDINSFLPGKFMGKKLSYNEERELSDYKEVLGTLIPWYIGRLEIIANGGQLDELRINELAELSKKAGRRYRGDDPLPEQLSTVYLELLKLATAIPVDVLKTFYDNRIKENKQVRIKTWIAAVRWANRLDHLTFLRDEMESYTHDRIRSDTEGSPDELSSDYVGLARAVLISSADNAAVYFNNAVEIASKVGEEIIHRWEAVVALASQSSASNLDQQEMAYRFIRVAELVGRDLREKHWSRSEAIQIAIALSPTGGIAALSRWRDRDIGRFHWLVNAMLHKLVETGKINCLEAWGFTPFCSTESLPYLLKGFLKSEIIPITEKNVILERAVKRLRCEISEEGYWYDLQSLSHEFELKSKTLEQTLSQLPAQKQKDKVSDIEREFMPDLDWDEIFKGHDLLTPEGITAVNRRIKKAAIEKQFHMGRQILIKAALARVADSDLIKFLEALLECDWLEQYDVNIFFEHLPSNRAARPAFVQKLPEIIENVGKRFPLNLTSEYSFDRFMKVVSRMAGKSRWLKSGIYNGMILNQEFASAENLYDLVRLAATDLNASDAAEVLAFALDRFEVHIDEDFGDGPWRSSLKTSGSAVNGLAGFLWSALGSPRSETRWRAAHALKELAQQGEKVFFDALFEYSRLSEIGAYGCERYPFYILHAKQYLLIACARISLDNAAFLKDYAKQILAFALDEDHLINQRFAADTALRIANALPGLFKDSEINALKLVGQSQILQSEEGMDDFPDRESEVRDDDESAKGFYFGYDFSRYWLGSLGGKFRLSQTEMVQRTAAIIVDEWKQDADRYDADPRVELWNRQRDDYRTHHTHGSYPRDHNYSFYLSYHAMMIVGARLLKELPLKDDEDISFAYSLDQWFYDHLLTRSDGYWLADWKDALPLRRPSWGDQDFKEWQAGINSEDMVRNLVFSQDSKVWLTVTGGWEEEFNSKRETYSVRSAFVSCNTSNALMRALNTCEDAYDYKLPDYKERGMEIKHGVFELTGWIEENSLSSSLDEYDPFAEDLPFSYLGVGKEIEQQLHLLPAMNGKEYIREITGETVIFTRQWASSKENRNEQPEQQGSRMNCSLEFLQDVCKELGRDIIIEVRVDRNMSYSYRSSREDKRQPAIHKLFILSENGELRSSEGSYRIREIAS